MPHGVMEESWLERVRIQQEADGSPKLPIYVPSPLEHMAHTYPSAQSGYYEMNKLVYTSGQPIST